MKPTVYIETTIVSYLTAWPSRDVHRLSHQIRTQDWWAKDRSAFELYTSQYTIDEVVRGDPVAAQERLRALQDLPLLAVGPAVDRLAEAVAAGLQIPRRARTDAFHLAVAAVHGVSFLLTWNCRHLANPALRDTIEETCNRHGFVAPQVATPEQLRAWP
jgi:predicted nucleic acid-binding protein